MYHHIFVSASIYLRREAFHTDFSSSFLFVRWEKNRLRGRPPRVLAALPHSLGIQLIYQMFLLKASWIISGIDPCAIYRREYDVNNGLCLFDAETFFCAIFDASLWINRFRLLPLERDNIQNQVLLTVHIFARFRSENKSRILCSAKLKIFVEFKWILLIVWFIRKTSWLVN